MNMHIHIPWVHQLRTPLPDKRTPKTFHTAPTPIPPNAGDVIIRRCTKKPQLGFCHCHSPLSTVVNILIISSFGLGAEDKTTTSCPKNTQLGICHRHSPFSTDVNISISISSHYLAGGITITICIKNLQRGICLCHSPFSTDENI
jgi:hypothetical protein